MNNDPQSAAKIEAENNGFAQKKLSHQIRIRHPHLWNKVRFPIMVRLDYGKYSQNPELRNFLLATGNREIIENNPRDQIWGPPGNTGGKIVMSVRDDLQGHSDLPEILILGDSLLKGLDPKFLSREIGRRVAVIALPGAKFQLVAIVAQFLAGPYVEDLL